MSPLFILMLSESSDFQYVTNIDLKSDGLVVLESRSICLL